MPDDSPPVAVAGLSWRPPDLASNGTDSGALLDQLFAALASRDVDTAVACFDDDAARSASTNRAADDVQSAREFVVWAMETASDFRAEVHGQVAVGTLVLNERTDHWTIDGEDVSVPTVGIFETDGSKITSWTDTTSDDLDPGSSEAVPSPAASVIVRPETEEPAAPELEYRATDSPPAHDVPAEPPSAEAPMASSVAPELVDAVEPELLSDDLEDAPPPADPVEAAPPFEHDPAAERIAALEADLHEWRRRAVLWRERALAARALGESLQTNLEDLRKLVQALEENAQVQAPAAPAIERVDADLDVTNRVVDAPHEPNWKLLFSRDFWAKFF